MERSPDLANPADASLDEGGAEARAHWEAEQMELDRSWSAPTPSRTRTRPHLPARDPLLAPPACPPPMRPLDSWTRLARPAPGFFPCPVSCRRPLLSPGAISSSLPGHRARYDQEEGGAMTVGEGTLANPFVGDETFFQKRSQELQKRAKRRDGSTMSLAQSKRASELDKDMNAWEENRMFTSGVARLQASERSPLPGTGRLPPAIAPREGFCLPAAGPQPPAVNLPLPTCLKPSVLLFGNSGSPQRFRGLFFLVLLHSHDRWRILG